MPKSRTTVPLNAWVRLAKLLVSRDFPIVINEALRRSRQPQRISRIERIITSERIRLTSLGDLRINAPELISRWVVVAVKQGAPSTRRTGTVSLYACFMARSDGWRWWRASQWLARPLGPPLDWLMKVTQSKLKDEPPEKALGRGKRSLAFTTRVFGPDAAPTAGMRARVAELLESMDRFADAQPFREDVLKAYRQHKGLDDPDTATAELFLAFNLCRQRKLSEARPILDRYYERRRSLGGAHDELAVRI